MTRPPPDRRQDGFRRSWVSNAQLWSAAARRLINTTDFAEVQLGFVALHLCLRCAVQLIDGTPTVPADMTARGDCPIEPRALRKLSSRLEKIRDEILHLSDLTGEGREVNISWSREEPHLTLHSTVGRHVMAKDSIAWPEVEAALDKLDPWLRVHRDRLLEVAT